MIIGNSQAAAGSAQFWHSDNKYRRTPERKNTSHQCHKLQPKRGRIKQAIKKALSDSFIKQAKKQ